MALEREEFVDLVSSIATSEPEMQGEIINKVIADYDERVTEDTTGLPEGASNWHEAYNGLHKRYIQRFVDGSPAPEKKEQEPEKSAPITFNDLFGKKE